MLHPGRSGILEHRVLPQIYHLPTKFPSPVSRIRTMELTYSLRDSRCEDHLIFVGIREFNIKSMMNLNNWSVIDTHTRSISITTSKNINTHLPIIKEN